MQLPKNRFNGGGSVKHIYLVRHCKATGQESGAELTEVGQLQAYQLSEFLTDKQIDYIVSSPFERALSSIRPLAQKLDLRIHIDNRLSERFLSSEKLDDWMNSLKETFEFMDLTLPGGESSREATKRGISVVEDLLKRPELNIAVVTHGNLLSLMLKYYDSRSGFDEWRRLTNPDVYELVFCISEVPRIKRRIWK